MKIDKQKLELEMARCCMSYTNLAKEAKVSLNTLTRMKNGVVEPRPATVGKIATALCVAVEDLTQLGLSE